MGHHRIVNIPVGTGRRKKDVIFFTRTQKIMVVPRIL